MGGRQAGSHPREALAHPLSGKLLWDKDAGSHQIGSSRWRVDLTGPGEGEV